MHTDPKRPSPTPWLARRSRRHGRAAFIACALAAALPGAGAGQLDGTSLTAPGYLVSVCAGNVGPSGDATAGTLIDALNGHSVCHSAQASAPQAGVTQAAHWDEDVYFPNQQLTAHQTADALATAGYGVIKVSSLYSGYSYSGYGEATATAGWSDRLTITPANPALNGQPATLNFTLAVNGSFAAQIGWNALATAAVAPWRGTASSGNVFSDTLNLTAGGGVSQSQKADHLVLNLSTTITLGQPFDLGIFARTIAADGSLGFGSTTMTNSATADFGHTITWNGITGVTVSQQALAYTLSSQSGVDWRQAVSPVPEPGRWALMLAGVLALGLQRRRPRADG